MHLLFLCQIILRMIWHNPEERNGITFVMELVLSVQAYRGMPFLCAWVQGMQYPYAGQGQPPCPVQWRFAT